MLPGESGGLDVGRRGGAAGCADHAQSLGALALGEGDQRERAVAEGDQQVVAFTGGDPQRIDGDRLHREAIGLEHGQPVPAQRHPVHGRAGSVDQSDAGALAGPGGEGLRGRREPAAQQVKRVLYVPGELGRDRRR